MKFKKGDRVYVHPNGWGNVVKKEGDFVKINFDNGNTYICDVCLVSFTEYDLVNGGFSQERPEPKIKEGQMVWAKDKDDDRWIYSKFVKYIKDGGVVTRSSQNYKVSWDQYSILNPYKDSIEAQAIELLRELKDLIPTHNLSKIYSIEKFLKEIDGYEK